MSERFVRLKIQVPAGVTVRTRSVKSRDGGLLGFGGLFQSSVQESTSDTPVTLELDVPDSELPKLLAQLKRVAGG